MRLTPSQVARRLGVTRGAEFNAQERGTLRFVKGTKHIDIADKRNTYLSNFTPQRGRQHDRPTPGRAKSLIKRLRSEYALRKQRLSLLLGGVLLRRMSDEAMSLFMHALCEGLRGIPARMSAKDAVAPGAWISKQVAQAIGKAKKSVALLKAGGGAEVDDLPDEAPGDADADGLRALLDSAQGRRFDTLTAISKGHLIKGSEHAARVARMAGDVSSLLLTLSRRCADTLAAKYNAEGLVKARAALREEFQDALARLSRHAGKRATRAREVEA